jgi:hypothetical protein
LAFGFKGFPKDGVRDWNDTQTDADDAEPVPPAQLPPAGGTP